MQDARSSAHACLLISSSPACKGMHAYYFSKSLAESQVRRSSVMPDLSSHIVPVFPKMHMCSASWDLQEEGLVFGLAFGPYGTVFALCWDRGHRHGGKSQLLLLHGDPSKLRQITTVDCVTESCLYNMHTFHT